MGMPGEPSAVGRRRAGHVPRAGHVAEVLRLVRPADGPGPFVLGIDGRSGSGKSQLADALLARLQTTHGPDGARGVALEDAYRGWHGLAAGVAEVAGGVLAPMSRGQAGSYRRYDWTAGQVSDLVPVPPPGAPLPAVLVVEGCGAGSVACVPFLHALAWLEAPEAVRRQRALDRDQHTWVELWEPWEAQESALLTERDTPTVADLVLHTG